MWVLFIEIWLWLLVAFTLGWVSHWFFCCRNKQDSDAIVKAATDESTNADAAIDNRSGEKTS